MNLKFETIDNIFRKIKQLHASNEYNQKIISKSDRKMDLYRESVENRPQMYRESVENRPQMYRENTENLPQMYRESASNVRT